MASQVKPEKRASDSSRSKELQMQTFWVIWHSSIEHTHVILQSTAQKIPTVSEIRGTHSLQLKSSWFTLFALGQSSWVVLAKKNLQNVSQNRRVVMSATALLDKKWLMNRS